MNQETSQNEAWCEALYDRLATNLILYGRSLGLTHGEAEDVLQDTFAALLKLRETPKLPEHYTLRAYRNRARNFRRNWWRRLQAEWESAQWFAADSVAHPAEEEAVRCLVELPLEQREVIVLKVWQRLTFDEIGNLLEISPNTAAGRFRYGMEKLRRKLNELGADYEAIDHEKIIGMEAQGGQSGH